MRIITKREVCLSAPDRWAAAYKGNKDASKAEITEKLQSLRVVNLTPETISSIIGNDSWTRLECSECGVDSAAVVEAANERFCESCVEKMRDRFFA